MTPKRNDVPLGGSERVMLCLDLWNLAWYVVPRILSYNQNQLLAASTPLATWEMLPPVRQGEDRTKEGGSCKNHMFGVSRQTGSWGSRMRYTTLSPRE